MGAIFRREFKAFFTGAIGCVVLAVMFAYSGYNFFAANLFSGSSDLSYIFSNLYTISLFAIPFLTMRLFSEDKKQKTDQALLTSPTGLTSIVLGKFFAALLLYIVSISITLVYAVVIATKVSPDWMVVIGNYIGLAMVGGVVIAIGVLISSLTESQIIAAIGTLAVSILLISLDILPIIFGTNEAVAAVTEFLSLNSRYTDFTIGMIHYDNIIFFLTTQALFLFLTVRVLDSRRWN